jgi:hypothetical protein
MKMKRSSASMMSLKGEVQVAAVSGLDGADSAGY